MAKPTIGNDAIMNQAESAPKRLQTRAEEWANSLSHWLGFVLAIIAIPVLVLRALKVGDEAYVVGASIFGASLTLLYLSSSLYHMMPRGRSKRVFKIIDHSAIYLLIAGTYTPFTLGALSGPWGWSLFGVIWGLAGLGILLKSFSRLHHPVWSTGLYLVMGWMVLVALVPLTRAVPTAGLIWLSAGGLAYTLGVVFYVLDHKIHYGHFVWHLFVLTGSLCHFVAVFGYAH